MYPLMKGWFRVGYPQPADFSDLEAHEHPCLGALFMAHMPLRMGRFLFLKSLISSYALFFDILINRKSGTTFLRFAQIIEPVMSASCHSKTTGTAGISGPVADIHQPTQMSRQHETQHLRH